VHCAGLDTMILLDDGVEYGSKVLVAVPVTSIDATVLVIKEQSASSCLTQSEA